MPRGVVGTGACGSCQQSVHCADYRGSRPRQSPSWPVPGWPPATPAGSPCGSGLPARLPSPARRRCWRQACAARLARLPIATATARWTALLHHPEAVGLPARSALPDAARQEAARLAARRLRMPVRSWRWALPSELLAVAEVLVQAGFAGHRFRPRCPSLAPAWPL